MSYVSQVCIMVDANGLDVQTLALSMFDAAIVCDIPTQRFHEKMVNTASSGSKGPAIFAIFGCYNYWSADDVQSFCRVVARDLERCVRWAHFDLENGYTEIGHETADGSDPAW